MESFVIEYESCEGERRWMTVDAEDVVDAEDTALEETMRFGDGIAEILSIYPGDFVHHGYDEDHPGDHRNKY